MHLQRDSQQWVFDWVVKETGRVFHFQGLGRGGLPPTVTTHAMISKHVGKRALQLERLAEEAERAGQRATALELYFDASATFAMAQHVIFENNAEKRFLHGHCQSAYARVRELSPYRIERVEVAYRDGTAYGNLHLLGGQAPAPCVIVIPGCDMTKELYPHPFWNHAHQRGMHVLVMDGPGQGESNLAGVRLTHDGYDLAVEAMVQGLGARDDVDASRIALLGASFGSLWALRAAKMLPQVAACVASWASVGDPRHLMDEESPRYKQLFAYLTQAADEAELDAVMARMAFDTSDGNIPCPVLMTVGEYDPRSPLTEVEERFAELMEPAELWIFDDQHHMCSVSRRPVVESMIWQHDSFATSMDWICQALDGRVHGKTIKRLTAAGPGPVSAGESSVSWFDGTDDS